MGSFTPTRLPPGQDKQSTRIKIANANFLLMSSALTKLETKIKTQEQSKKISTGTGGSGTTNKIPKWNTGSTLTDSIITESSGAISVGGSLSATGLIDAQGGIYDSAGSLDLQADAGQNITMFSGAASGETPILYIYGYATFGSQRSLQISCGSAGDDMAYFNGPSTFGFNGDLIFYGNNIQDGGGNWFGSDGAGNSTFQGTIASGTITVSSDLVLATGSITSASAAISFGDENLSTTGTLSAGVITGTSFTDSTMTITGGAAATLTFNMASNTLTGTKAQFNTSCSDGAFLFVGDVTSPSTKAEFNAACGDGTFIFVGDTIDLSTTSLTGTKAEFDTACSDGDFAYSGGAFHDGFSDFVANEHIDHTSVTLSAGVGLSGGGDISANRTFTFDATELDAITWSDGANASNIWTFDVSGTNTTITFGNALVTFSHALTVTGIATLADTSTLASDAAPTADAEIANKKYVDDNAGSSVSFGLVSQIPYTNATVDDFDYIAGFEFDGTDRFTIPSGGAYQFGGTDIMLAGNTSSLQVGEGANIGTGDYCLMMGASAGGAGNNTGYRQIFLGTEAGEANTSGFSNLAIGYQALHANTTGNGNLAIGYRASYSSNVSYNLAIGYQALDSATSGTQNTAIGYQALQSMLTNHGSLAIGYKAGYSATGPSNVAIGTQSLYVNSSGRENVALGYEAHKNGNINGSIAIGHQSLYYSTSSYCIGIGTRASFRKQTGAGAVVIGYYAAYGSGYYTGNYNTIIGTQAGYNTTNSSSVILGYYAGYYNVTSKRLIIDNMKRTNAATEVTNSLIHGDFHATPSSQSLRLNADVLVRYDLTVAGNNVSDSGGVIFTFDGAQNLEYGGNTLHATGNKANFGDSAIGIYSQADTFLDFFADGGMRFGDSSAGAPTNYAQIAPDGEINLFGTARVKKEVKLSVGSFAPGASGASASPLGCYPGWSFGINDDMLSEFEIPFDWDTSTDLEIKVYWYIGEAYASNNAEIQWEVTWSACPSDETEAVDAPTHTGTIDYGDQDVPATAKYLTKTPGGTIAAASLSQGDLIGICVKRIALDGGNDPLPWEPVMAHLEVEYIANKLGEAT